VKARSVDYQVSRLHNLKFFSHDMKLVCCLDRTDQQTQKLSICFYLSPLNPLDVKGQGRLA
jgi:hypothetical protein